MADVALWLGPYMSISSKAQFCTRTKKGPEISANHNKPNNPQTSQTTRKILQPDLRFVKRNNKPDTHKGREPKQKHPPKRFAKGHSGLTTASLSKTCENELRTTTFKQTWRPKKFACLLWHRCAEAVHEHGAATYASLSVLSDQLVQKASMDRIVTIYSPWARMSWWSLCQVPPQ